MMGLGELDVTHTSYKVDITILKAILGLLDRIMRYFVLVTGLMFISVAHADLMISFINESSLPYEYSKSNYSNSPSNYSNSISNYSNSISNYSNSPSNYNNSPSKNGTNSENRLLVKDGSTLQRVGYYIYTDSGVINFFSTSGKRMFYNPQKGIGVFQGSSGGFTGVLVPIENEYQLFLNETGQKTLFMSQ